MSFYGNVYYQTLGAIAKIIIQNSGILNSNFIDESKLTTSVEMDTSGKKEALGFDSGNRWIQLKGDLNSNKCSIWHGPPDKNSDIFTSLLNVEDNPTSEMLMNSTVLDLSKGLCFSSPKIYYDNAGHFYNGGEVEYFRVPVVTGGGGGTSSFEGTDEDALRLLQKVGFIDIISEDDDSIFVSNNNEVFIL